jgi:hypothetical protein
MSATRILIELEAGTSARELEAAAALAGRIGAELSGLFLEDASLLRFAALPFACEIGFASGARRRTGVGAMERSLQALASAAQRELASVAQRREVRWSFRVERGASPETLLCAAAACLPGPPGETLRLLLLGDGEAPVLRWVEHARAARRLELVRTAGVAELSAALGADPGIVVAAAAERVLAQAGFAELLRESGATLLLPSLRRSRVA